MRWTQTKEGRAFLSSKFKEAWRRAEEGAKEHGGSKNDYFNSALNEVNNDIAQNNLDLTYYKSAMDYIKNQIAFWSQAGKAGVTAYNRAIINAYERMHEILEDFKNENPLTYATLLKKRQRELMSALGALEDWQYHYHHTGDAGGVVEQLYDVIYGEVQEVEVIDRFGRKHKEKHFVVDLDKLSPTELAKHDSYVDVDNELSAASRELMDDMDITSPDFQY